jgi:uncharacterized protein YdeI (BOF family)
MKKTLLISMIVGVVAFNLVGCSGGSSEDAAPPKGSPPETKTVDEAAKSDPRMEKLMKERGGGDGEGN